MRRAAGKKVSEKTAALTAAAAGNLNNEHQLSSSSSHDPTKNLEQEDNLELEIYPEILSQLGPQSRHVDVRTVSAVAEYLATEHEELLDFSKNFRLIQNPQEFQTVLQQAIVTLESHHFLLILIDNKFWASLSLIRYKNDNIILYKDPRGVALNNEEYLKILKESPLASKKIFCHTSVDILPDKDKEGDAVGSENETCVVIDSALCSLKNLEIIVKNLKSHDNAAAAGDFIQNFRSTKFTHSSQLPLVREGYRKNLQANWSSQLTRDMLKLKRDGKFKEFIHELNIFIDTCLKYVELAGPTENYVRILQHQLENNEEEGMEEDEENFKKLDQAKATIINCEQVQRTIQQQMDIISSKSNQNSDLNNTAKTIDSDRMDIEKKFPWQMKVFTNIFCPLFKSKRDVKLATAIREVSKSFGLDEEKLKLFFKLEEEHLKKKETLDKSLQDTKEGQEDQQEVMINGVNLNKLMSTLSAIEGKKLEVKKKASQVDPEVKTIDQILFEYVRDNKQNKGTTPKSQKNCQKSSDQQPPVNLDPNLTFYSDTEKLNQFYATNEPAAELKSQYLKVKKFYKENWATKTVTDVRQWALSIRQKNAPPAADDTPSWSVDDYCMAIAALDRLNELLTLGHRLRDPQIISVLSFLGQRQDKGKLCQIQTGEGKTVIVAFVAAIKILAGEKFLDVITSNNVLAQEALDDKRNFFSLLGLTVDTNNNKEEAAGGPEKDEKLAKLQKNQKKSCYSADIVFGSIANFQFDYLRDLTESNCRIRGSRRFGTLILDEVDSMIVDSGGHIAKLASPLPGMDCLKFVYIKIWQILCTAEKKYVEVAVEKIKKNSDATQSQDDQQPGGQFLSNQNLNMALNAYDHFRQTIVDNLSLDSLSRIIPGHLQKFAKSSLDRWIDNAMYAKFSCHENEQYSLHRNDKNGEIVVVPLDYANTGVTMKNTIWSHGLHQFVQLKHNLQLTAESLTSSCISNYGYINLYGNKIFGLTGTMGSTPERELMGRMYNVEFSSIPTFKTKKFVELRGRVARDPDWAVHIAIEAERQTLLDNRAILIINKTIADCLMVEKALKSLEKYGGGGGGGGFKIKKFLDESGAHILKTVVDCGDVIIATNIAGRGADFKTTKALEEKGGLHVCTTFYPDNERVKEQAFFRTARQGNRGSARIIMRESEAKSLGIDTRGGLLNSVDFNEIKSKVESIEENRINSLVQTKVAQLYFQDYLFSLFAQLCRDLGGHLSTTITFGQNIFEKISNKSTTKDGGGDGHMTLHALHDLKEFWAFWLEEQKFDQQFKSPFTFQEEDSNKAQEGTGTLDLIARIESELRKKADTCIQQFKIAAGEILGGKISHNPYYCIQQADDFLDTDRLDEAQAALERAISLSQNDGGGSAAGSATGTTDVLYAAHMKLFEVAVRRGQVLMNRFKDAVAKVFVFGYFLNTKDEEYKESARQHLKNAKDALETEIDYMRDNLSTNNPEFLGILTHNNDKEGGSGGGGNIFLKHLESRLVCLTIFFENASQLLSQLEESESHAHPYGMYIGSRVPNYLQKLEDKDPEKGMKEVIQEATLKELRVVGLDTIYALQKVHDAPTQIIAAAQAQIGAGIAIHAAGICFPPILPITIPLAGVLISEGILDIALELLVNCQGKSEFNGRAYLHGKLVSYSISLLTAGLTAIASSTQILEKASKACQSLANLLRKCPMMKSLCQAIAKQLDKLAGWIKAIAESAKEAAKLRQLDKLSTISWQATKGAAKGVVGSLVMEKVTTHVLEASLQNLKPTIATQVTITVDQNIDKRCLNMSTKVPGQREEVVMNHCKSILERSLGQMLLKVAEEVGLGLLRHSNTWKVKLASLAIDTCLTTSKLLTYTTQFCDQLNTLMKKDCDPLEEGQEEDPKMGEKIQKKIVHLITDQVYSMIIQLAGKYTNMLVVKPLVNKLFDLMSSKKKEEEKVKKEDKDVEEEEKKREGKVQKEGKENPDEKLRKKLNLPPDASDEEIKHAYCRLDAETSTNLEKAQAGLEAVKNGGPVGSSREMDILSDAMGKPIKVIDGEGKVTVFGADRHPGKEPALAQFHKGVNGQAGHYTSLGGKEPITSSSSLGGGETTTNPAAPPGTTTTTTTTDNDCLLKVLARQSDRPLSPDDMRGVLKTQYAQDIEKLSNENVETEKLYLAYNESLIGGCPTISLSVNQCEKVLNDSEGRAGHAQDKLGASLGKTPAEGHARDSHVLPGPATGKQAKTVFQTRQDQDTIASEILNHPTVNAALDHELNVNKVDECVVKIPSSELPPHVLPNIVKVKPGKGTPSAPAPPESFTMLVGHQKNEVNNPTSDPHIQTLFPSFTPVSGITVTPKPVVTTPAAPTPAAPTPAAPTPPAP